MLITSLGLGGKGKGESEEYMLFEESEGCFLTGVHGWACD